MSAPSGTVWPTRINLKRTDGGETSVSYDELADLVEASRTYRAALEVASVPPSAPLAWSNAATLMVLFVVCGWAMIWVVRGRR